MESALRVEKLERNRVGDIQTGVGEPETVVGGIYQTEPGETIDLFSIE